MNQFAIPLCKGAEFYPFGFDEYSKKVKINDDTEIEQTAKKPKKTNTSPLKELSRLETAVKKLEKQIAALEQESEQLNSELSSEENLSDFKKLTELDEKIKEIDLLLNTLYSEWEDAVLKRDELNATINK